MTLSYEATLDDLAQPVIRQFFRSQTARKNRITSSLWAGFTPALVIGLYFRDKPLPAVIIGCVVAATVGASVAYSIYPSTIRKRLRRYVAREHGQSIPAPTTYFLEEDSIRCESLGVAVTFCLDDLMEVVEDAQTLELSFGAKGLCVIPMRAFKTPDEKGTFLSKTKNANKAVHPTATRVTPHA
jgi:hypothetical protein